MSPDDAGLRAPDAAGAGLRASDAERDEVAAELGEHFQAGRLDQAEFDDRVTVALRARTRRDLGALLTDLPERPSLVSPAGGGPADRPGWAGYRVLPVLVPLLFAAVIAAGWAANGAGHWGSHHWTGPWPLLWLWVIPFLVFRLRRRRVREQWAVGQHAPGQGTHDGRQGQWQ